MREIEFRAKLNGANEWIYGDLVSHRNKSPKNGKFIGVISTILKDKSGVKIYEGDVVKMLNIDEYPMQIKWSEEWARFIFYNLVDKKEMNLFTEQCEVIGNIYDNPELIKESE